MTLPLAAYFARRGIPFDRILVTQDGGTTVSPLYRARLGPGERERLRTDRGDLEGLDVSRDPLSAALARLGATEVTDRPDTDLTTVGCKALATTGSMTAGSNTLTVADATGFEVGDPVIVAVGGEAGGGMRGTRGVGGTWPSLSYVDAATREADTTQDDDIHAWDEDTGNVYRWDATDGAWVQRTFYYLAKACPKALHATVTAVGGNTLTLDAAAAVDTTDAAVHFDNQPAMQAAFVRGLDISEDGYFATFRLPAGEFAVGNMVLLRNMAGVRLTGAGKDATTIFSPPGVPSATIVVGGLHDQVVENLHLRGNHGADGYGLGWLQTEPNGNGEPHVRETGVANNVYAYPNGVFFTGLSRGLARNLRVTDVFQKAVGVSATTDTWAIDCENVQTDSFYAYVQWQFQWADSVRGGCVNCTVDSDWLIPGFEDFSCNGTMFLNCKGRNVGCAINSGGNFFWEDLSLTVEQGSQHPNGSWSKYNPLLNINDNMQRLTLPLLGGTIRNARILVEGYINDDNDVPRGITIAHAYDGVRIEGGRYEAPDWIEPSTLQGPVGLDTGASPSTNTLVDGFTVVGRAKAGAPNIRVIHGEVRNSDAQVIDAP